MTNALKWLALILLFLNLGYFVWSIAYEEKYELKTIDQPQQASQSLKLLQELDPKDLRSSRQKSTPALLLTEPYCPSVGPFDKESVPNELRKQLLEKKIYSQVRPVVISSNEKFRVFIPPYESKAEALEVLTSLRAKKIDSYILSTPPLMHAISLGVFSQQASAEAFVQKMLTSGYKAISQRTFVEDTQYWLDITRNSSSETLDKTLISIMSDVKGLTQIDSPCKSVALP